MIECASDRKPLGRSICKEIFEDAKGCLLVPSSFSIDATQSHSAILTSIQNSIKAVTGRIDYISDQSVISVEPILEENVIQTFQSGKKKKVRNGQYGFDFMIDENLEYHKMLHSHDSRGGAIIPFDSKYRVLGQSPLQLGADFKGLTINLFDAKNIKFNNESDTTVLGFGISLNNPFEINNLGWTEDWSDIIPSLIPLTLVNLAVKTGTTPTSSLVVITVKSALDNTPIAGLSVGADFDVSGLGGSPGTIVDNGDGSYNIPGTGLSTGPVNLVAASALSLDAYESSGPVTVTI